MFTERFDAGVQVDLVPFAFVDSGEEPQVFDDALDPPQAFAGSLDQLGKVVQGVVQIERFAHLVDLVKDRLFLGIVGPLRAAR